MDIEYVKELYKPEQLQKTEIKNYFINIVYST